MKYKMDKDITSAKTIDADFYTSRSEFEACREKIFGPSWQFIGSTELVTEKSDINPFILLEGMLNEPLALTRDKTDNLHLISNVCTHRGNIIAEKPCKQTSLRCRYHGRQFGLDGKFISMPEFKEVKDFPSASDDLHKLPLFQWAKWLFTTLDKKYEPELFFSDMMKRVNWMPLDTFKYSPDLSREFKVRANWALYCENYLEGFHIPFVHTGLNAVIDFGTYATELFYPYSSLQIGIAKDDSECFELPESSPDYGKNIAAYYFWVFPNMMFNFYPWGLSVNIVEPLSVNESRVLFKSYVWDASKLEKGAGSGLDKVEQEDEEIVENVQRGVRSRFYRHGRYSVNREKGTHHFHCLISEFMNRDQ